MIPNKLAEFLWNQKFKDYTTFIFGSKWSNSTLYELNGKKWFSLYPNFYVKTEI